MQRKWRDEWKTTTTFTCSVFIIKFPLVVLDWSFTWFAKTWKMACHPTGCSHQAWVKEPQWALRSGWYYGVYLFTAATRPKYGNLDHEICPVTVYISLIVSASPSSQSIHYLSGYCSVPPSWWSRTGHTQRSSRKPLLKTEGMEQSVAGDPTHGLPGPRTQSCSQVVLCFIWHVPASDPHSHHPTTFPCAVHA